MPSADANQERGAETIFPRVEKMDAERCMGFGFTGLRWVLKDDEPDENIAASCLYGLDNGDEPTTGCWRHERNDAVTVGLFSFPAKLHAQT